MRYVRLEKYVTGKHDMLVILKDFFNAIPSCKYMYERKQMFIFFKFTCCANDELHVVCSHSR
jgi:hypothetical protein